MPPTVHWIVAGLLAAVVGAPGSLASCRASPALFPLADGNRWTLADEGGTTTAISMRRSTLHGLPGAGPLRVRSRGGAVEAWDAADRRWEPFFRLGAPAGTRYRVDLPRTALWRGVDVTVASRNATVRDARGRVHRGAVRLDVRARKPVADAGVEELAFAPGVGPVRIVVGTIAGPRTLLLRSYRIRG